MFGFGSKTTTATKDGKMIITAKSTMDFMAYQSLAVPGMPIKWMGANGWLISATVVSGGPDLRVKEKDSERPYLVYVEQLAEITRGDKIYRNMSNYDLRTLDRPDQHPLWKYRDALGAAITFEKDLLITGPLVPPNGEQTLLAQAVQILSRNGIPHKLNEMFAIGWDIPGREIKWRFQDAPEVTVQPQ